MTHLLDRTRSAAAGVVGATVGSSPSKAAAARCAGQGLGVAYALSGIAMNPQFVAIAP
jgi:hypothetical protein